MTNYGMYVWPCYLITFVFLFLKTLNSFLVWRKTVRELRDHFESLA